MSGESPAGAAFTATAAQNATAAGDCTPAAGQTDISVSRGMTRWMTAVNTSFAFTSYQSGQLFAVGALPDGAVSFNQHFFTRAMGLCWRPNRLYLGSCFQIWRLENMLRPGEVANGHFDAALIPRNAQTTGDVDTHEVAVDSSGRVIFVNTSYSCLATLDLAHSFRPIWKPSFISALVPEDRCHLNGLAMANGQPKYVTAVSRSDVVQGWRERRHEGGVLIDVDTDRIVTDQLSMPHSPRVVGGSVYLLESGRGYLVRVDPQTGNKADVAFCPGFLRGLAIHNNHAIVTVSKPRETTFAGLTLQDEIERRDAEAWCGVLVIDLSTGAIVEWLKLEGFIRELFDVVAMPGVRCPMVIGPTSSEMQLAVSFDPEIRPLEQPDARA